MTDFGRYRLGRRIGVGGMGEVYLARQTGLGGFEKAVVLKLLLPHLAGEPEAVGMFLAEAQLAARMRHPNLVEIYDVGAEADRYFIAMELVRGAAANQLVRALREAGESLELGELVHLGRALCAGLHHAHELRGERGEALEVVHRDVTPHNILLSTEGQVKLADFGIAKVRDSVSATRPGMVRGKFEYLAPEQLEGTPVDRRADVYAAALSLFHLATLQSPFRREGDAPTFDAVRKGALPDLRALRPDLPLPFVRALERALARAPAQRFATARELGEALGDPPPPSAAALLGARVQRLCAAHLDALSEQATPAVPGPATASLAREPPTELATTEGRRSPASRGGAWALGALGLLVVAAAGGLWPRDAPAPGTARSAPAAQAAPVARGPDVAPPTAAAPAPPGSGEPDVAPPIAAASPPAGPGEPGAPPPTATGPSSPARAPAGATPSARAAPGPVPSAPRVGFLTVDARPWARVSVGGKDVGETPMDRFPLPAGEVVVTLQNPDTGKRVSRKVRIAAGRDAFLKADLR